MKALLASFSTQFAQFKQQIASDLADFGRIQAALAGAMLEATSSISDRMLDQMVSLSDEVKLLIFHLLDHRDLKLNVEHRNLSFIEQNLPRFDAFLERLVQIVIKVQKHTMELLQEGEQGAGGTSKSTKPRLDSRFATSKEDPVLAPYSKRLTSSSMEGDGGTNPLLQITKLEQQLVSLLEGTHKHEQPDSGKPRDVTLEELLAASRASTARKASQNSPSDLTWGSELKELYQNQLNLKQHEKTGSSVSEVPSPIPDTEGIYFLLHPGQAPVSSSTPEVKKLHFSKKIKKRDKRDLELSLESLEKLVIHPDLWSEQPSAAHSPPPEPKQSVDCSLIENAQPCVEPFITRQKTTLLDSKLPSLPYSGHPSQKLQPRKKSPPKPLKSLGRSSKNYAVQEKRASKKPTPRHVMLKLPIRSPATPPPDSTGKQGSLLQNYMKRLQKSRNGGVKAYRSAAVAGESSSWIKPN